MEMEQTALLVIGAGPYSIATAAYAQYLGVTGDGRGQDARFLEDEYAARHVLALGSGLAH